MSPPKILVLLVCLFFLYGVKGEITLLTSNDTNFETKYNALSASCTASPVSKLKLCNTTCETCLSTDSTRCETCGTGYTLKSAACIVDQRIYNYDYFKFMEGASLSDDQRNISRFRFSQTQEAFSIKQITSVCKESSSLSYEFFTAGLFQSNAIIDLPITRVNPIDQIRIKLNFASMVQNMKLFITINDNQIYSKQFAGFSDLTGTFALSPNETERSFLNLSVLNTDTAPQIWVPIDTGLLNYTVTNYSLKFYVQTSSSSNNTYVWGFNDMTILTRDCQTCVSKAVLDLMSNLGVGILVVAIIVIVLVIILFLAIALQEYRRKVAFQKSLGTTASNLPTKAINRLLDTIFSLKKTREKEWIAQGKKFNKAFNKLHSKRPKSMAL